MSHQNPGPTAAGVILTFALFGLNISGLQRTVSVPAGRPAIAPPPVATVPAVLAAVLSALYGG